MRDVEHCFALAHRERQLIDFATRQLPENVFAGHRVVEEIFPGFWRTSRDLPCVHLKRDSAADHAVLCQDAACRAAGRAVRNRDEYTRTAEPLVGLLDAIPN